MLAIPFHRARYPTNWTALAHGAKETADWRCARCGAPDGALRFSQRNRLYLVSLAACHHDHDQANPTPRLAVF